MQQRPDLQRLGFTSWGFSEHGEVMGVKESGTREIIGSFDRDGEFAMAEGFVYAYKLTLPEAVEVEIRVHNALHSAVLKSLKGQIPWDAKAFHLRAVGIAGMIYDPVAKAWRVTYDEAD